MAHKQSSKKTSFGKRSEPEKAFLKKGRNRKEEDDDKPRRSYGRSTDFVKRGDGNKKDTRFEKRGSKRFFESDDKPQRPFDRSTDKSVRSSSDWKKKSRPGEFPKREGRRSSSDAGQRPFPKPHFDKRSDRPFDSDRKKDSTEDYRPSRSVKSLGFTKKSKPKPAPSYDKITDGSKKDDGLVRLNKHIANSGMGSRREADEMIKKGLISVNGVTITEMGFKVKKGDVVRYEDKVLKAEKPVYVLLNKPKGFITTTSDPKDRKTVMNLVASACKERLYPVGRLDRNTTGLLLLTNDGDLAEKLTHPSYNTKKIYKVELDKPLTKNDFQKIQEGVHLEEGKAIVDDIAMVGDDKKTIGIELHIGWNRIVRRIFESLDYEVVKLDRVIFAGLDKKDLPRGEWRFLKPEEVVRLKHFK